MCLIHIESFDRKWTEKFPEVLPNAEMLKFNYPDRWIRLYTLPEAKRYADNSEESEEIISRYISVLSELKTSEIVHVIVCEWGGNPVPTRDTQNLEEKNANKTYWKSFKEDSEESDTRSISYRHVYVQQFEMHDPQFRELLRRVAEDETEGVIVTPSNMNWLFHPYDGGMDIVTESVMQKNTITDKYKEWMAT